MDVYRTKLDQDQLNTQEFWVKLEADEQSQNIFAVTEDRINRAMAAQILTLEKGNKLKIFGYGTDQISCIAAR